jgi:hypothetical protein
MSIHPVFRYFVNEKGQKNPSYQMRSPNIPTVQTAVPSCHLLSVVLFSLTLLGQEAVSYSLAAIVNESTGSIHNIPHCVLFSTATSTNTSRHCLNTVYSVIKKTAGRRIYLICSIPHPSWLIIPNMDSAVHTQFRCPLTY